MRTGHTTRMRWGLDQVEIPPLRTSSNGWHYDYDGQPLGRGGEGSQAASRTIQNKRMRILAAHDWKVPDEVWPQHSLAYRSSGLQARFEHPVFGSTAVTLLPGHNTLYLDAHPLLYELHTKQPFDRQHNIKLPEAKKTSELAENLWELARDYWPEVLGQIDTPSGPTRWKQSGEFPQSDGSTTEALDMASYFRQMTTEALEQATSQRIHALIEMFQVLGHTNTRVLTTYAPKPEGYGSMQIVTGIQVQVRDPDHEESHTVNITATGQATISCGYRDSDEKYLEYQKRSLAGWMQDELGDIAEFEEYTFDNN